MGLRITKQAVTVTVSAEGAATAYSEVFNGKLIAVQYVKDDYADGVDFTITAEKSGLGIWTDTNINASETVFPMIAAQDNTGAAISYASGYPIYVPIPLCDERVKIVIASGGASTSGTFNILVEGV
jgi:hypothetical protein